MKKINIRYYTKKIWHWLFNATLLLSVFTFSGFNLPAQSAFVQSLKIELVVSRIAKPSKQLKWLSKKNCKTQLAISPFTESSFNVWTLFIYKNILKNKFKRFKKRTFHSYLNTVKLFFKIPRPSSEDKSIYIFLT